MQPSAEALSEALPEVALADDQLPQHTGGGWVGTKLTLGAFAFIHTAPLWAIYTGVSARSIVLCLVLFRLRMFGITGWYHRYFSHRSFKTTRWFAFLWGFITTGAVQKGPLWWAGVHRRHHRYSDQPEDVHSPRQRGFWYSHVFWITAKDHVVTEMKSVKDLARHPELTWLNRHHYVAPALMAMGCYLIDGARGLVVGFGVSTVLLFHATFVINSLAHVIGTRRYRTDDDSRNHWLLALITMGEGWHNNHHHYQSSVRQGFFWWEIDLSYYLLRGCESLGLVWDLKLPSERVLADHREEGAPSALDKAA